MGYVPREAVMSKFMPLSIVIFSSGEKTLVSQGLVIFDNGYVDVYLSKILSYENISI